MSIGGGINAQFFNPFANVAKPIQGAGNKGLPQQKAGVQKEAGSKEDSGSVEQKKRRIDSIMAQIAVIEKRMDDAKKKHDQEIGKIQDPVSKIKRTEMFNTTMMTYNKQIQALASQLVKESASMSAGLNTAAFGGGNGGGSFGVQSGLNLTA